MVTTEMEAGNAICVVSSRKKQTEKDGSLILLRQRLTRQRAVVFEALYDGQDRIHYGRQLFVIQKKNISYGERTAASWSKRAATYGERWSGDEQSELCAPTLTAEAFRP